MLVRVRKDRLTEEYVEISSDERLGIAHTDTARKIAFFHVMKRKPEDYNELVHTTTIIQIENVSTEAVNVYKRLLLG